MLLDFLLELGKRQQQPRLHRVLPQVCDSALVHLACPVDGAMLVLELGKLHPRAHLRYHPHKLLKDGTGTLGLVVAQLHLYVRRPRVVFRLPLDPAVKDLAGARHVPDHLLHVCVLVPELVDAREDGDGAVPDVARAVDVAVAHLHLGVLEPQRHVAVVHLERALPHAARAVELQLRLLPHGVLHPQRHRVPVAPDPVLELLPLPLPILRQLVRVRDLLLRGLRVLLLSLLRLAEDLLCGDLHGGRLLVLDSRHGVEATHACSSPVLVVAIVAAITLGHEPVYGFLLVVHRVGFARKGGKV
mmetsp:Transcript_46484/g.95063  ORF Transcript_46484/g.95063 Transcript_46484/m.95063 type:complete len:301 (+) Transcript_46484:889-1791(+)